MIDRPKILDLFCGGGGAGMGYSRSGFEVIGVDIQIQPKYPFEFIQGDAIEYVLDHGHEFDAIHASPPCQSFTSATRQWRKEGYKYNDLIGDTRKALTVIGNPWVIENVINAPLIDPIMLCGSMFGLRTYRHRAFESNFSIVTPDHHRHIVSQTKMGRPPKENEFIQVVGHFSGIKVARKAMDIDWLGQKELAQAIPPAYTEFIGLQLLRLLNKDKH